MSAVGIWHRIMIDTNKIQSRLLKKMLEWKNVVSIAMG